MTGFGKGEAEKNGLSISVELKSVNHRFLDLNIREPRTLLFLEDFVRNKIKSNIERGHIDVFLNYRDTSDNVRDISLNLNFAKKYIEMANRISEETGMVNDLNMASLLKMEGVLDFDDSKIDEELLKSLVDEALQKALDSLVAAREVEGKKMVADLIERKVILDGVIEKIEKREPVVVEIYREKLREKVTEYIESAEIDESRFSQEILYFSDHASLTEEIVRIHAHLEELLKLLTSTEATGRKLDFLIQELNREFNTTGSKANDIEITKLVLQAKSEIEKIREQIQNLE